jgi:hypothetical protein
MNQSVGRTGNEGYVTDDVTNRQSEPMPLSECLKKMAGTTGLEPAASAVTGQRSNQLNYVPTLFSPG